MKATIVIPNLNGKKYLEKCLDSLRKQTSGEFTTVLIDNGSRDGSADFVGQNYPEVQVFRFEENKGFCGAVNQGIRMADTPYVILLNNDTVCEPDFVQEMINGIEHSENCFSCSARMVQMRDPSLMDDGGDYYCALGWAYGAGKGKPAEQYSVKKEIFSACGGAAIYRKDVFKEIGLFDEEHFAYLEDVDVAYRARIAGYRNYYIPSAVVQHVGSGTSGSTYNAFKVRYSSRNSVYLIYKNMPFLQIILNVPFLAAGFGIKALFFIKKGFGREYAAGLLEGVRLCSRNGKVKFRFRNLKHYLRIQWELWINTIRRLSGV